MAGPCADLRPDSLYGPLQAKTRRSFPGGKIPSFLPQPSDEHATPDNVHPTQIAGPGPWATGRVMWTPSANVTGVRSVVDRYTITRYSPKDWRKKNKEVLDLSLDTSRLKDNVRCTVERIVAGADKQKTQNTSMLAERVRFVEACKAEMEGLVKDLREEIVLLTETKVKVKYALPALKMPESIAGECIDRRSTRLEQDLVNDDVEVELVKELAMVKDTRDVYTSVVKTIEQQILANRACKDQLEMTWSDKKETCELEAINVCLRTTSPTISHFGGAVRLPDNQSSPESWGIFNATLITAAEEELEKSRKLRNVVENNLLVESVQDLRNQADKVHQALAKRIHETDQCRQMFERELQVVLGQIAEAESQYASLLNLQRQLDYSTKVVQTRLNNRLQRQRVENCRDEAQYGLLEEAKYLNTSQGDLKRQIEEVDKTVSELYKARANLEYAITTKRKSLYVDQQRCMAYRQKYPDSFALSGDTS